MTLIKEITDNFYTQADIANLLIMAGKSTSHLSPKGLIRLAHFTEGLRRAYDLNNDEEFKYSSGNNTLPNIYKMLTSTPEQVYVMINNANKKLLEIKAEYDKDK